MSCEFYSRLCCSISVPIIRSRNDGKAMLVKKMSACAGCGIAYASRLSLFGETALARLPQQHTRAHFETSSLKTENASYTVPHKHLARYCRTIDSLERLWFTNIYLRCLSGPSTIMKSVYVSRFRKPPIINSQPHPPLIELQKYSPVILGKHIR
jgi:hypothetical protein